MCVALAALLIMHAVHTGKTDASEPGTHYAPPPPPPPPPLEIELGLHVPGGPHMEGNIDLRNEPAFVDTVLHLALTWS